MYEQQERKRFLLELGYEPRTTAWRPDIATLELEGRLLSDRYHEGIRYQVTIPSTPLRFEPWADSPVESQLLFGEVLLVYDTDLSLGLAWGKTEHDGHVGFVRYGDLTPYAVEATHWVSVPFTPVLPRPDRKAESLFEICFNARVTVYERDIEDPVYVRIGDNQWVFIGDLRAIGHWLDDPLEVALEFVNVSSYLWGYRNGAGFDCSGITQAVHRAAGRFCLRDADQQEGDPGMGSSLPFGDPLAGRRRYDQVHFPGHVAIMVDETMALHAKGDNVRKLTVEPLSDVIQWRLHDYEGIVRTIRRLF